MNILNWLNWVLHKFVSTVAEHGFCLKLYKEETHVLTAHMFNCVFQQKVPNIYPQNGLELPYMRNRWNDLLHSKNALQVNVYLLCEILLWSVIDHQHLDEPS